MTIDGKTDLYVIGIENGARVDRFNPEKMCFDVVG